jgi:hypothetical protein
MTKKPKRVMTKASKAGCRSAGGLRRKLGEDFLAHLNRSWELHGREILARVRAERPLFQGAGQVDTGSAPCDWRTDRLRPEAQSRGSIATPRSANS